MNRTLQLGLVCALFVRLPAATAETAILQLQVVEGEGAVNTAGARSSKPLTIQVTDETGRPVEGVAVSFRLPDEQVTGTFATSLKTEIVVSNSDGKASVWGIHWSPAPGPVRIRVTAAKDQARAGILVNQYVSESAAVSEIAPGGTSASSGSRNVKWKWIAVAAGAMGGGLAVGIARPKTAGTAAGAGAVTVPPLQVGPPTITIGRP